MKNIIVIFILIYISSFSFSNLLFAEKDSNILKKESIFKLILNLSNKYEEFENGNVELKPFQKVIIKKNIDKIYNSSEKISFAYGKSYAMYYYASLDYRNREFLKALKNLKKSEDYYSDIEDSLSLKRYNLIANIHIFLNNFEKAKYYLLQAQKYLKNRGRENEILYSLVYVNYKLKNYKVALEYLDKHYKNIDKSDKNSLKKLYNYYSIIYRLIGDRESLKKALDYKHRELDILVENNDYENLHYVYYEVGKLFSSLKLYDKAITQYKKAIKVIKKSDDEKNIIKYFINLSAVYRYTNQNEKSLKILLDTYNMIQKKLIYKRISIDDKIFYMNGLALITNNLGDIYKFNKEYQNAIKYIKESIDIKNSFGLYNDLFLQHATMAEILSKIGDYQEADKYIDQAKLLIENKNDNLALLKLLKVISRIAANKNEFRQAYKYSNAYIVLKDSIKIESNAKNLVDESLIYSHDKISDTAEKTQGELEIYKPLSILTTIILILLGILVRIIFSRLKMKRKHALEIELKNQTLNNQNQQLLIFNREINERDQELHLQNKKLNDINDELTTREEELEKSNSEKDRFLSIIGHDLKNPLQSILMTSEVIEANFWKFKRDKFLSSVKSIRETTELIKNLLENLLTWAIAQNGQIKVEPQSLNLYNLVANNIDILSGSLSQKNIKISNFVDGDICIFVDLVTINTVIRNLLTNAIKFTKANGTIIISSEIKDEVFIQLNIIDTGVGMSKETMDKLFKIDVQHTNKGTQGEKGTGLGLLLVQDFIFLNGGKIEVKSELGMGSTFSILLKQDKLNISQENNKEIKKLFVKNN